MITQSALSNVTTAKSKLRSLPVSHLWPVFVFAFFVVISASVNAASTPAFWKVQSKTATVYLMGSMHFGHKNFYPLPKVINDAFLSSQVLVVELDITKIAPMDAMAAVMKHGRLAPGETLQKILQPKTMALLEAQSKNGGLPLQALQNFKPWFAAMQMVEAALRNTEYKQNLGVDYYFLTQAQSKSVVALESLDGQLALFSKLSNKQQESFLIQTMTEMSDSKRYLDQIARQWQIGDTKGLEKTLLEPFQAEPEIQAFYKALFIDRNHSMADAVVQHLKGSKTVFFVVGAGHMLGKEGIFSLVKKAGFNPQALSPRLANPK